MEKRLRLNSLHHRLRNSLITLLILVITGCSVQLPAQPGDLGKIFPYIQPSYTPFQPVTATPPPTLTSTPTLPPTQTPEPARELSIWLDPSLPPGLRNAVHLPDDAFLAANADTAALIVGAVRGGPPMQSSWIYALVAPFPTLVDDVSLAEVQSAWRGEASPNFGSQPLIMSASTRAAFTALWGPAADSGTQVVDQSSLLDTAWSNQPSWAIIPFEEIEPRWKVLRVDGVSPMDREFDIQSYPLAVQFGVSGNQNTLDKLEFALGSEPGLFPASNRDPDKLTVLVMTGVTALARATAAKMDLHGPAYPASDIHNWLYNADITHISNEVSFNPDCPLADPMSTSMMFCSRPEYIELLDYIGTDIVELSGNHNNDWGREYSTYTLELYKERGWPVFAGGANLEEAAKPAFIEHNGQRLVFLGCNRVGPTQAFATETEPGALPCDMDTMAATVRDLRAQGYLPVVTFQYNEYYIYGPGEEQQRDFRAMAEAGAVIVSGSQAHFPQTVEFDNGAFIHYGLGNLFFDQMDIPVVGTRQEFIDRHVFYNGRYLGVELLTAMLEDYARPRPMTLDERRDLLSNIFQAAAKWLK